MAYAESPPPPELAGIVACRWRRVASAAGERADVLPDGCMDVIARDDGHVFVAGPDTRPAPAHLPPGTSLVGLRFRPGAGPAVLGVPASELRDGRPGLVQLWGGAAAEVEERAAAAGSDAERLALLEAELLRRLRADPSAPVGALGLDLGLGERQLRRRFHAAVGYGPKVLARVLRLQRLFALAAASRNGDLAGLALDAGYADQAHMTVECGRLTGRTPSALLRDRFVKDPPVAAA